MLTVGLLPNVEKADAIALASRLIKWLHEKNVNIIVPSSCAAYLRDGDADFVTGDQDWAEDAEFIIALGGDGTLLAAARDKSASRKPILGINLGRLGFLTEIEAKDIFSQLPQFLAGNYIIEHRIMLKACLVNQTGHIKEFVALNDAVVAKGPFARLLSLEVYVGKTLLASYPADGIIVSTPTGSTAYSLSAGGPVVSPNLDVFIITPICPHTLYARPVIVSTHEQIRICIRGEHRDSMLTLDGQEGSQLMPGDETVVSRSDRTIKLLRKPNWSFYEVLRKKLAERDPEEP